MRQGLLSNLRVKLSRPTWRRDVLTLLMAFLAAATVALPIAQRVALTRSQVLLDSVAEQVSLAMLMGDDQKVDQILRNLQTQPTVLSVNLSNAQGAVVASYERSGGGFESLSGQNFELASVELSSQQKIHLSEPLIFDGHIIATLSLGINLWPIYWRFISWSGGILIAATALLVFLRHQKISIYFEKISPRPGAERNTDKNFVKTAFERQLKLAGIQIEYQPIVRLSDGGVFGAELLVSWLHPSGQTLYISPADWVALCKKSELFLPVANWLLETSCNQIARWQKQFGPLILSINISKDQLKDQAFGQTVRAVCEQAGYPHQLLEFEISEASLLNLPFKTTRKWMESFIKDQRLSLTLDGFGMVAQSAQALDDLDIQKININHKLTKSFLNDSMIRDWVKTLCDQALTTDTQIRAEGIETQAQQDGLQALGCLFGQGPKFGHPMNADQFGEYLQTHFLSTRKKQVVEKLLVI